MEKTNFLTKNDPSILIEAGKGKQTKNYLLQILMFIAAFIGGQILSSIPIVIYTIIKLIAAGPEAENINMGDDDFTVLSLFSTGIATIHTLVFVRFMERRNMHSVGFVRKKWALDWLIGGAAGVVMLAAALGICVLFGAMEFEGFALNGKWLMLALFFVGFLIQGMSEEVICRGYFMNSIAGKGSVLAAIILSSAVFAALHLANANLTVLAIVNLMLFGVIEALLILRCDSIWLACGVHSLWNFAQGNIFGIAVSGGGYSTTVMRFAPAEGMDWLSGGAFGIEGGIACTIVLVAGIVLTLVWSGKRSRAETEE